ncbi:hypothetical protein ACNKU7_06180 [Microbulbifer sp. SA54]|uniref:hypothetical protein n=1 Tax=Microbulbifer sp. SA54 TaxID=3401577 RepID=UPI003AAC059E
MQVGIAVREQGFGIRIHGNIGVFRSYLLALRGIDRGEAEGRQVQDKRQVEGGGGKTVADDGGFDFRGFRHVKGYPVFLVELSIIGEFSEELNGFHIRPCIVDQ